MQFIEKDKNYVVLGIPSKGRMKDHTINFLQQKGFEMINPDQRVLQTTLSDKRYKVCLMHAKDIPVMLEKGLIDIGFTGIDLIHETQSKSLRPIIKTGLGRVKMVLAVPESSIATHPFHLMNQRISTSYEHIAQEYFDKLNVAVEINKIHGASEGMPYLGVCDGIVDVVETGNSLRANKLKIIADNLFESELVVAVHKPEFSCNYKLINEFISQLY